MINPPAKKWSQYKHGFKRACRRERRFGLWEAVFLGLPIYYNLRPLNFPRELNQPNFSSGYIEALYLFFSLPKVLFEILLWRIKNRKGCVVSIASNRQQLIAFARQLARQNGVLVVSDGQIEDCGHRSIDARAINLIRGGVTIIAGYLSLFFAYAVRHDIRCLCRIYGARQVAFSLGDICWFHSVKLFLPRGEIFFSNFLVPKVAKFWKVARFEEIQHGVIDRFHWDYAKVPNIKSAIHFYSEENARMCSRYRHEFDFAIKLFDSSVTDQISEASSVDFLVFPPGPHQYLDETTCIELVNVLTKHGAVAIKEHPRASYSSPELLELIIEGSSLPDFKAAFCGISSVYYDWSNLKDVCVLFDGSDDMGAFEAGILPETMRPHNIPNSIIEELESVGLFALNRVIER